MYFLDAAELATLGQRMTNVGTGHPDTVAELEAKLRAGGQAQSKWENYSMPLPVPCSSG